MNLKIFPLPFVYGIDVDNSIQKQIVEPDEVESINPPVFIIAIPSTVWSLFLKDIRSVWESN